MDNQLIEVAKKFIGAFEEVFDNDWSYTKEMMSIEDYISPNGTFLQPKVADQVEDWGNRAILLK